MRRHLKAARSAKETRWCPPFGSPTDWQLHTNETTIAAAAAEAESRVRNRDTGPGKVMVEVREGGAKYSALYEVDVRMNDVRSVRRISPPPESLERFEAVLDESIASGRAPLFDG